MAYTTATINSRDNMAELMDCEFAATGTFPKGSYDQWLVLAKRVEKEEQEMTTLF